MESSTGKILAMVSKPDFDPNLVDKDYDKWKIFKKLDKKQRYWEIYNK